MRGRKVCGAPGAPYCTSSIIPLSHLANEGGLCVCWFQGEKGSTSPNSGSYHDIRSEGVHVYRRYRHARALTHLLLCARSLSSCFLVTLIIASLKTRMKAFEGVRAVTPGSQG
jgi:hypothetical protein